MIYIYLNVGNTWTTEVYLTEKWKIAPEVRSRRQAAVQEIRLIQLRDVVDADPHLQDEQRAQHAEEADVEEYQQNYFQNEQ